MEIIKNEKWIEVLNSNGSIGKKIINTNGTELVHLSLVKNAEIPVHTLPFDVLFFIAKGNPILLSENKEIKCAENQSVFCDKNEPRGWKNASNEEVKILVIKFMENK